MFESHVREPSSSINTTEFAQKVQKLKTPARPVQNIPTLLSQVNAHCTYANILLKMN